MLREDENKSGNDNLIHVAGIVFSPHVLTAMQGGVPQNEIERHKLTEENPGRIPVFPNISGNWDMIRIAFLVSVGTFCRPRALCR